MRNAISAKLSTLLMEFITRGKFAIFGTLTLSDDEFLTNSFDGVNKKHLKPLIDYMRNENKKHPNQFAYFFTSEYGSKTDRPHYHCILYGFDNLKHCEDILQRYYPFGLFSISEVNPARFNYCASSHITKSSHVPEYLDDDVIVSCNKPFTITSPRLGYAYATQNHKQLWKDGVFKYDGRVYHLSDGIKHRLVQLHYNSRNLPTSYFRLKERMEENAIKDTTEQIIEDGFLRYLPDFMKPSDFTPDGLEDTIIKGIQTQHRKFNDQNVTKKNTNCV